MNTPAKTLSAKKRRLPILARHAISLSIVFVIAVLGSYFAGHAIYQKVQLSKLTSSDQATFEQGVGYVLTHAGSEPAVTDSALDAIQTIEPQRAADLLLATAQAHAKQNSDGMPQPINDAISPLMQRLEPLPAIGLYDSLITIKGVDAAHAAQCLLASLDPRDDAELLQIVDLLDTRLLWSRRWAPLELWVRWLSVLAQSDSELTQFNTAKRLGDLPEAVGDAAVAEALTRLSASGFETVRAVVLNACAGYAAMAEDPTEYEQIIFKLGQDENQHIARRAWMVVGHLNPFSGFAVNWKDADPFVAEGMLWAAVKTNRGNPQPALMAMNIPELAHASMLALSNSDRYTFSDLATMKGLNLPYPTDMTTNQQAIAVWRRILAIDPYAPDPELWYIDTIGFTKSLDTFHQKYGRPINQEIEARFRIAFYLAATYRLNIAYETADFELSEEQLNASRLAAAEGRLLESFQREFDQTDSLPIFAALINASAGYGNEDLQAMIGKLPLDASVVLDLFALALTHAKDEVIDRFIGSRNPQMVTMAALASAIKGSKPKLVAGFDLDFPRRHPDITMDQIRAMSDVDLSELDLSRVDALPALLEAAESAPPSANRSTEAKLLKLALWMRGDLGEDFTPTAEAMLFDEALPTSTVLMCLLHMQRPIALDYLFGDLVTPRPDLQKLFIQERYWHVFRRFVDTSDLTLWLWGDPAAQAFQLEAMQQWYAVNRWRIEGGWWPELIEESE